MSTNQDTVRKNNIGEKAHILVVEDEPDLREMLVFGLESQEYILSSAADGQSGWVSLVDNPPDLILLDWMLPDISGLELLRRLRREPRLSTIPVIMLTARDEEMDRVRGLDSGADDYITKPFSTRELGARIRAQLRRSKPEGETESLECNGLEINTVSHRVSVNDQSVELGPTEFRLLQFLMSSPERVFTRANLLDGVWGANVYIEERTVDVHIRRLRKALEPFEKSNLIQTIRGTGYRFSAKTD